MDFPPLVNGGLGHDLLSDPDQTPFIELRQEPLAPGAVLAAGQALLNDVKQQAAIAQALATAFQNPGQPCPIYIYLQDAPRAELLPWECLYDPQLFFLSLQRNWPVVRMRQAQQGEVSDYTLQPPLRVLAVLSAAGDSAATAVSAVQEWQALWQAFTVQRPPQPMPVSLRILVGEDELKAAIEATLPPAGVQVRCEFISDRDQILSIIKNFAPHLLHVFCHGATSGMPHLQIGTRKDWAARTPGSITLTAAELRDRADPTYQIWMITLNCCDSATQSRDARNLASSMVAAGFPAALGMRDVIDVRHAYLLANRFYRALFEQLNSISENTPPVVVEWGTALFMARQDLSTHAFAVPPVPPVHIAACDSKEWTLPALYTRTEPFRLKRLPPPPPLSRAEKIELLEQIQELQQQLVKVQAMSLPDSIKHDAVQDLEREIATLGAQLNA